MTRKSASTTSPPGATRWARTAIVLTDPTLQNPRCVYQLMKAHFSRYTPEVVERICGTPKDAFLKVCGMIAETSATDRTMTIMYALGWTQHTQGSQMIRTGAMVQLLLGNIGVAGGGMNALRGHSNIQGLTDLGLLSNLLPGYMTLPGEAEQDFQAYLDQALAQAAAARPVELLAELPQVLREHHEGLVWGCRHAPRTTGATTGCPSSTRPTTSCRCSRT